MTFLFCTFCVPNWFVIVTWAVYLPFGLEFGMFMTSWKRFAPRTTGFPLHLDALRVPEPDDDRDRLI